MQLTLSLHPLLVIVGVSVPVAHCEGNSSYGVNVFFGSTRPAHCLWLLNGQRLVGNEDGLERLQTLRID